MAELEAIVLKEDEEFMRHVKEDGKRYTRMDFLKEIQKARKRKLKLQFVGKTCIREQVYDILESRDLAPELLELYYEVMLNKVVDGKDPDRFKFFDPTTFTSYKGYIQWGGDIKSQFYREMTLMHHRPIHDLCPNQAGKSLASRHCQL